MHEISLDDDNKKNIEKKDIEFMKKLEDKIQYVSIDQSLFYPDPTDLILNLALLEFLPVGTKLHFYKGKIYLQEKGFYQSISRTIFSGSKDEISIYPISLTHGFTLHTDPRMNNIYRYAIRGLKKLKKTYSEVNCVIYCIEICITYIENYLNNTKIYLFTNDTKKYTTNINILHIKNLDNIHNIFGAISHEINNKKRDKLVYDIIYLLHKNNNSFYGSIINFMDP